MEKNKPADVVINLFGVRPLARDLTKRGLPITPGAICHWRDTGLVPSRFHETLLELAKQAKKKLTAEMLVCGTV